MEIFLQTDLDISPPQVPKHRGMVKYINYSNSPEIFLSAASWISSCCHYFAATSEQDSWVLNQLWLLIRGKKSTTWRMHILFSISRTGKSRWKVILNKVCAKVFTFSIASKTYGWLLCHFGKVKWIGEFETPQISPISSHLLYNNFCNDSRIPLTFRKCSKGQEMF